MRKNWKKVAGAALAVLMGISMVPASAAHAEEEEREIQITEKTQEVNDLEMTEEQLQYAFLLPQVVWVDEISEWTRVFTLEGYEDIAPADDDFDPEKLMKWNYEGVVIREAPVGDIYDREAVFETFCNAKMLHFSTEDYDYYLGVGYTPRSNRYWDETGWHGEESYYWAKTTIRESVDKKTKESWVSYWTIGYLCTEDEEEESGWMVTDECIGSYSSNAMDMNEWLTRAIEAVPGKADAEAVNFSVSMEEKSFW